MWVPGIDVSHHQGRIDWHAVKRSGVSFAYLKATEATTFVDPRFFENVQGCVDTGIPWGAYHFAHPSPGSNALQEARHFHATVNRAGVPSLPPALDIEQSSLNKQGTTAWARVFLGDTHFLFSRRPVVYTGPGFAAQYLDGTDPRLRDFPLWVAHYTTGNPTIPRPWTTWVIWQHTSKSKVPGIGGNVDHNFAESAWLTQEERTVSDLEFILLAYSALGLKADRDGVRYWLGQLRNSNRTAIYEAIAVNDGDPHT